MLTGQYPDNHGIRTNQQPSGGYAELVPTEGNTLPVWLQRSGYATAHIGKYLNGYGTVSNDTHVPPGWSEWYGSLDDPDAFTGGTYTMYGYTLNENGAVVHYGSTPDVVDPATYQTDVYSAKAADFILGKLRTKDGRLLRTYAGDQAKLNAYLDDYAFLVHGLLALPVPVSLPLMLMAPPEVLLIWPEVTVLTVAFPTFVPASAKPATMAPPTNTTGPSRAKSSTPSTKSSTLRRLSDCAMLSRLSATWREYPATREWP